MVPDMSGSLGDRDLATLVEGGELRIVLTVFFQFKEKD